MENYPARARLKGDLSEHWGNAKQWSLRINLKIMKHLMVSMNFQYLFLPKRFSIQFCNFRAYRRNQF